jgi:plasmid stabilization system protein ParE
MARTLEFHAGARRDFDQSFDWYARRSTRAATGFATAIDDAVAEIVENPERFPGTRAGCRYCSLKRYPFRIVFRHTHHRVVIVAVAHAKRRPGYWSKRR